MSKKFDSKSNNKNNIKANKKSSKNDNKSNNKKNIKNKINNINKDDKLLNNINKELDKQEKIFIDKHQNSLNYLKEANNYMPNGVANSLQSYYPFSIVLKSADGSYLSDIDDNSYLDLHLGYGTNIFGHNHQDLINLDNNGLIHTASPDINSYEYAKKISQRFNSQKTQFTPSGSEATWLAIRLARAYTNKDKILKIRGAYNGNHDWVMFSLKPSKEEIVKYQKGKKLKPSISGIPKSLSNFIEDVEFNDLKVLEEKLATKEFACFILEPVLCNLSMITPKNNYLNKVRKLCDKYNCVLIFDQVKTGATISYNGAINLYNVNPDLQTLGKALGGGMPIGIVTGKSDIMNLVVDSEYYSTFSAHNYTIKTGLKAIELLDKNVYEYFEELNIYLKDNLNYLINKHNIEAHVITMGAKGGIYFNKKPFKNYKDWIEKTPFELSQLAWLYLLNNNIFITPGADEQWTLSLTLEKDDLNILIDTLEEFFVLYNSFKN